MSYLRGWFFLPRFVLHTLFHVPVGSFLEPILWQGGIVELFLSLLCLEANILFGRRIQGVGVILCTIAFVFCITMYFGGHSVESLIHILASVYAGGWIVLGVYRLVHSRLNNGLQKV
jgi:hypothetical protein